MTFLLGVGALLVAWKVHLMSLDVEIQICDINDYLLTDKDRGHNAEVRRLTVKQGRLDRLSFAMFVVGLCFTVLALFEVMAEILR